MTSREVLCLSLGVDAGVLLMILNYVAANWYGPRLDRWLGSRKEQARQRRMPEVA
jgi:hypothetical protein